MSGEENIGGPYNSMHKEIKNNNKQPYLYPDGDANANQIPMEESHTEKGDLIPPLLSHSTTQEGIIIWGTHAHSEDPELEEFELLECQEMEAFLTERVMRDHNTNKESAKKDCCQRQSALTCLDPASDLGKTDQNANHSKIVDVDQSTQPLDLRTAASRSGGRRSFRETRSNSESNVFVPTFSTVSNLSGSLASALDSAGHTLGLSSLPSKPTSEKCQFQQPATNKLIVLSTQNKEQQRKRDQNPTSTVLPQDPTHERRSSIENGDCMTDRQCWSIEKGYNREENILSSKFQRNFERVPPSSRQLVRPLSSGMASSLTSGHPAYKDTTLGERPSPSSDGGPKNNQPVQINSNAQSVRSDSMIQPSQSSTKVCNIFIRRGSSENAASSLEKKSHLSRRAYSSPTRPLTPPSPKSTGSPQRHAPMSPGRTRVPTRGPQLGYGASQGYGFGLRPPVKTTISTNVQNHVPQQNSAVTSSPPKCPPKPKSVRPKIITYIRKSPQLKPQATDSSYEVSSLPTKLSTSISSLNTKTLAEEPHGAVLSASNLLYDKYRQELQKPQYISPESVVSGTKPSSHTLPNKPIGRTSNFYGSLGNKYLPGAIASGAKDLSESQTTTQETGGFLQPPRTLRPQLGVGAVSKSPPAVAAKSRIFTPQKSPLALSQPVQAVTPSVTAQASLLVTPSTLCPPEASDQWKAPPTGPPFKFPVPKPTPSGLRPPGYSRLPSARLAAFGFVRSSSVSSVSSNHSTDSTRTDLCRPAHRPGSVIEEPPFHRVITTSCADGQRVPCRSSPQPPSTPVPTRRPLLPPPPGSPVGSRKDFQKSPEGSHSALSSPKRLAVVSPKPQSPVLQRQRAAAVRVPVVPGGLGPTVTGRTISLGSEKKKEEEQKKEKEREEQEKRDNDVLQLQAQCKEQNGQLLALRAELKRTVLGLDVLAICTQHFCLKSANAGKKEKELSLELRQIQEEVACTTIQWKLLQQEKASLEQSFELQLRELQEQQEAELATLEEELRTRHASDTDHLRTEHQSHVEELRTQQQEQIEELTAQNESALEDLKTMHNITMAGLQEEHARTMRDLRKAHEKQKAILENDFEKHKLSLQDQVDMLTFQNQTLQDKAKRFEEALKKRADEQILDVLAPYQHIEKDLKSLKEVLEMKNQQIHDQERKISHLEKVAQKNIYLEEKVQVLQQQNEDLKARIDRNVALSRQLSEENANLQEHVERETNEKKRLSRNNDELLWLLQTSPHLSPSSSPSHRVFFPGFDNSPFPGSPSPGTPTHSYSPGPCTPSHKMGSPSPGTPTHRASPAARCSPARVPNTNSLPR